MAIQKIRRRIERVVEPLQATLQTPNFLIPGQMGFALDTNALVIRDLVESSYNTYVITGAGGGLSPVSPTVGTIPKYASGSTVDDSSLSENLTHIVTAKPISLPLDPVNSYEASNKNYVDNNFLNKNGDSMTGGNLGLFLNPTLPAHATSKNYVDTNFVALAGGTMTGPLVLSGDPTLALHPVTKQYLDGKVLTGTFPFSLYAGISNQLLGSGVITYVKTEDFVTLYIPQTSGVMASTQNSLYIPNSAFPLIIDPSGVGSCLNIVQIDGGGVSRYTGVAFVFGGDISFRNNDNASIFTSGNLAGISDTIFTYYKP